jgi:multiple antibiotic resistance protein
VIDGYDSSLIDPVITLLVVANILPILPTVLGVVSQLPPAQRRRTTLRALLVGNVVALIFALGGGALLAAIGSGVDDVRVAGGLILLIFAIYDLLFSREQRKEPLGEIVEGQIENPDTEVGLVPLGIPLLVGPASLAAVLFISEAYGFAIAALAILINASINVAILFASDMIMERAGHGAMRASGKVFGLLLAAMAVSMIRSGITQMVNAS